MPLVSSVTSPNSAADCYYPPFAVAAAGKPVRCVCAVRTEF